MKGPEQRIEPRTRASIRARLRCPRGERESDVLNASSRGMMGLASDPPARGDYVELAFGQHHIAGQVRWQKGHRFGLRFRERVSVTALLDGGNGPIALSAQGASRQGRGIALAAMPTQTALLARIMQFALLLAFVAGCAWGLARFAGRELSSLDTARAAMQGATDHQT